MVILAGMPAWVSAQAYTTTKTTNEKALRAYNEGRALASKGEAGLALGYFEQAVRADAKFIDAYLAMADNYVDLKDLFKSERFFETAIALDSAYAPLAFCRVAQVEWMLDKYDECAGHLEQYFRTAPKNSKTKSDAERLLANARFAAWAVKNPTPFDPQPLGDSINTPYDEYFPCLTADGNTLVFTRNDPAFTGDENFYRSRKINGVWQGARAFTEINTTDNEGAQAISPDGGWIVFTACNRENDGSQGSCDLYWSQEKGRSWTKPVPFSHTINSASWDSQPSISADGKSIVFSSRRPGGFGKEDLWETKRQAGGRWLAPVNLGAPINTGGSEQTPFLHPDGQTLYFCSDSLPGMGGLDIYYVRRNADGSWGVPHNLGYPINTKDNEIALFVSLDGKTGYFSSNRPSPGRPASLDIVQFEMPESARPKPVTYARILIRDKNTGKPLSAKADFIDLKSGQIYVSATSRGADGTALACLPAGRDYGLHVNKDKYLFYSANFNLLETATFDRPFELSVDLIPVPDSLSVPVPGTVVVLNNVFFETGSAELKPESSAEIDRLAILLKQSPQLRIQINGHTDHVGTEADNQALSEARAKSVYQALNARGIELARLRFKGFGETKPLGDNNTPEGRAQNRRTEFEIW